MGYIPTKQLPPTGREYDEPGIQLTQEARTRKWLTSLSRDTRLAYGRSVHTVSAAAVWRLKKPESKRSCRAELCTGVGVDLRF